MPKMDELAAAFFGRAFAIRSFKAIGNALNIVTDFKTAGKHEELDDKLPNTLTAIQTGFANLNDNEEDRKRFLSAAFEYPLMQETAKDGKDRNVMHEFKSAISKRASTD